MGGGAGRHGRFAGPPAAGGGAPAHPGAGDEIPPGIGVGTPPPADAYAGGGGGAP
jgi:hypothetical protein